MNSYRHAQASARRWGGTPEDYLKVHAFIDSSKQVIGDVRHRALYHHTLGVFLCEQIFGPVLKISKSRHEGLFVAVPTREVAEQHIIEDLGWLPSPSDYFNGMPLHTWMGGPVRKSTTLAHLTAASDGTASEGTPQ